MTTYATGRMRAAGLRAPVRNRYFYGKLLDAYHFQLETDYANSKRWLINRLVLGYGVVCGLDVRAGPEPNQIRIMPGVAIDKLGREVIVDRPTEPITIPDHVLRDAADAYEQSEDEDEEPCVQVLLCYHECETDPVPVLAGDCRDGEACAPGTIRERYKISFKEGCAPPVDRDCNIPHVISGGRINYPALAIWVSDDCPEPPADPCITLANVRLSEDEGGYRHKGRPEDIDITVRPIVYGNDLLFELLKAVMSGSPSRGRK